MKRSIRVLGLAMLTLSLPVLALAQTGGLRYSITVSKFENKAGWAGQWDIGDAWGTIMTDLLNQTGKFIVLGEKDMRQEAMAEQDFAASGRAAGGAKAPVTGQMTPAQLLVKGAITHVQDSTAGGHGGVSVGGFRIGGAGGKGEVNATIYIVDSTTGQVLASKSVVGRLDEEGPRPRLQRRRLGRRRRRVPEGQRRQGGHRRLQGGGGLPRRSSCRRSPGPARSPRWPAARCT